MDLSGAWRAAPAREELRRTFHEPALDDRDWAEVTVPVDADKATIEAAALAVPNVAKFVGDAPPRRVIVVPGRLINIIPG